MLHQPHSINHIGVNEQLNQKKSTFINLSKINRIFVSPKKLKKNKNKLGLMYRKSDVRQVGHTGTYDILLYIWFIDEEQSAYITN